MVVIMMHYFLTIFIVHEVINEEQTLREEHRLIMKYIEEKQQTK